MKLAVARNLSLWLSRRLYLAVFHHHLGVVDLSITASPRIELAGQHRHRIEEDLDAVCSESRSGQSGLCIVAVDQVGAWWQHSIFLHDVDQAQEVDKDYRVNTRNVSEEVLFTVETYLGEFFGLDFLSDELLSLCD